MSSFDGVFLDGWSLADVPVRIALTEDSLQIADANGAVLRTWRLSALHIDAMQEGDTYHLSHDSAPHEELVLKNAELARQLLARDKRAAVLPGGSHKVAFGVACLAALGALMGGLYWLAPKLAHFAAVRIPLEQERALGAELDFVLTIDRCDNKLAEVTLRELVAKLADGHGVHYDVRIVRMPMPNAFALPGGVVLVTDGFLRDAKSGDEIAGVLAHEVEHIEQRHVLAGALRDVLLTALWSVTFGDYSGLLVVDPSTAYRIANLEFSREDEATADRGAVARLHRLGASHLGLVSFFERLHDLQGEEGPAWLSTHPNTSERIRTLRGVQDVLHPSVLLSEEQLQILRNGCK